MDVKATLETKTSKAGNSYKVVVLKLTDTYDKLVFLDKAEIELLEANKKDDFSNPFKTK